MTMYKNVLLIGAVLVGCMCSNVRAVDDRCLISNMPYYNIDQFDVSGEIAALKQAKAERDNAIQNSHSDVKMIEDAREKYKNIKKQKLDGIKNRLRGIYMQGHEVTRHGYSWCKGDDHISGPYLLYNPYPSEWVIIPESCRWVVHRSIGGSISNPRFENNNYIVDIKVGSPILALGEIIGMKRKGGEGKCEVDFTLVGRFRYNDALIEKMLKNDMVILQARIESAL